MKRKKKEEKNVLYHGFFSRLLGYLFIIPYTAAYPSLALRAETLELVLYFLGASVLIFLIAYGNNSPYIIIRPKQMEISIHHEFYRTVIPYDESVSIRKLTEWKVRINRPEKSQIIIRMRKKRIQKLLTLLKATNIEVIDT